MGGKAKDPNKAAMRAQKDQMGRLDKIDLPELERLALESPELVGLLDAEQLGGSALEDIQLDPRLQGMQMQALEGMQERADSGLSTEDRYMMEDLLGQAASQEKSQRAGIEAEMARRGTGGSGQELMMKLQNQQASGNQGRRQAMELAQQAAQGKQSALANMSNMAGSMQGADYSRQSNAASAKDRIAQANAQNRQQVSGQNLAARQNIANQRSQINNQNQMYNKNLSQQQFQNELSKAGAQGGVSSNMSNIAGNAAQKPGAIQSGLSGAATGASIGSSMGPGGAGYGAAIGAGAGLVSSMFEDGGVAQSEVRPADERQEAEDKQHSQFKKKYLKKIHDEILSHGGTPDPIKAADGFSGAFGDARQAHGGDGGQFEYQGKQYTTDLAKEAPVAPQLTDDEKYGAGVVASGKMTEGELTNKRDGIDGDALAKGLGAIGSLVGGAPQQRTKLDLQSAPIVMPENVMHRGMDQLQQFRAEDGGQYYSDGSGEIVDSGMESYADDRVDAKLNDGEAVINVPQQQRLMDLIRGKISADELGTEDIVEGVPREHRDEMHDEIEDDKMSALERLLMKMEE
jgi:hypothetical protein